MMAAGEARVARGKYGPQPVHAIRSAHRTRSRRAAVVAGFLGQRLVAVFSRLRPVTPGERNLVRSAENQPAFAAWIPDRAPSGFAIEAAEVAPFSRDVLTITLRDAGGRNFEIAERRRWLPLEEELATAAVPYDRVPGVASQLFLVHGKYGGEPIDLSFWSTRRGLFFERGDLVIEFREVIRRGPGLATLIRFAEVSQDHKGGARERGI
jgi:hypothetical protein